MCSFQGRFRASGGNFVTFTYNSVTDAKDHLRGPLRFIFTTTVVSSNGRQVVVVIDFFKRSLQQISESMCLCMCTTASKSTSSSIKVFIYSALDLVAQDSVWLPSQNISLHMHQPFQAVIQSLALLCSVTALVAAIQYSQMYSDDPQNTCNSPAHTKRRRHMPPDTDTIIYAINHTQWDQQASRKKKD